MGNPSCSLRLLRSIPRYAKPPQGRLLLKKISTPWTYCGGRCSELARTSIITLRTGFSKASSTIDGLKLAHGTKKVETCRASRTDGRNLKLARWKKCTASFPHPTTHQSTV